MDAGLVPRVDVTKGTAFEPVRYHVTEGDLGEVHETRIYPIHPVRLFVCARASALGRAADGRITRRLESLRWLHHRRRRSRGCMRARSPCFSS